MSIDSGVAVDPVNPVTFKPVHSSFENITGLKLTGLMVLTLLTV